MKGREREERKKLGEGLRELGAKTNEKKRGTVGMKYERSGDKERKDQVEEWEKETRREEAQLTRE